MQRILASEFFFQPEKRTWPVSCFIHGPFWPKIKMAGVCPKLQDLILPTVEDGKKAACGIWRKSGAAEQILRLAQ
jgi:hypothetical protein